MRNSLVLGTKEFFLKQFFPLIASRSDFLVAVAGSLGIDLLPSGIDAFAGHAAGTRRGWEILNEPGTMRGSLPD